MTKVLTYTIGTGQFNI